VTLAADLAHIPSSKPVGISLTTCPNFRDHLTYDSNNFRAFLAGRGSTPVIKPNPTRKNPPPFDQLSYKGRNVIERAFCHLKDWRRVATRYDKLARNFQATVALAVIFT
jgi:putative transposase